MSTKISALPAASAPNIADTNVFPVVDATTTTAKMTIAQLRTQVQAALITSGVDGLQFLRLGASTASQYFDVRNTGGVLVLGLEGSPAGLIAGATAYDVSLRGNVGISFSADGGVSVHVRIASTGIATFAKQVVITAGGLSVTAGGLSVTAGDTVMAGAALATAATSGHFFVPTSAGVPSGVPTSHTGTAAFQFDSLTNKPWIYLGGSWRSGSAFV